MPSKDHFDLLEKFQFYRNLHLNIIYCPVIFGTLMTSFLPLCMGKKYVCDNLAVKDPCFSVEVMEKCVIGNFCQQKYDTLVQTIEIEI